MFIAYLVNCMLFGVALAVAGIYAWNWEFWVLLALFIANYIISREEMARPDALNNMSGNAEIHEFLTGAKRLGHRLGLEPLKPSSILGLLISIFCAG